MNVPKITNKTRRQNRKKKLAETRNAEFSSVKQSLPQMDTKQIIAAFKNSQNAQFGNVHQALKDLQAKMGKLNQGYIEKKAFAKAGVDTVSKLRDKLDADNIDYSGIPLNVLEQLVALDDWGSISAVAWPLIKQFGAPILHSLYQKYVRPRIDRYMGGDEGINPADWGSPLGPARFTPVLGENVEIPGVKSIIDQSGSFDTVDPKSIASTITPELYKHRYAFVQTQKTAIANVSVEYSITTNVLGQVGACFFPLNAMSSGLSSNECYAAIFNASNFTVTTGQQSAAATFIEGPLFGSSAAISSFRTTNYAIQVIPTASFNTAGAFTMAYNNRAKLGYTQFNTGTTLAQLKTFPFVTSFNNKTTARMINVTGDPADEGFVTVSAYSRNQTFILFGSGLPVSTEVARVVITSVVEFIPDVTALPICVMDYPRIGPMTENFESMMFMRFPVLQQLDLADAKKIADSFPDGPVSFNTLFRLLAACVSGIKPRQYVSHIQASDIALPGDSVEFAIE
jgi:hypothetical protein